MRTSRAILSLALLALVLGTPLSASTIDTFSSLDAIVTFDISPSALAVTVQNLRTVDATANTLTAIRFAFEPGGAPASMTLDSVNAPEFYTCDGSGTGTRCSSAGPDPLAAPRYGWVVQGTSPEFALYAGGGFKPGAIVNDSIVANGRDGLGNEQHIPYLGGPVTFSLSGNFEGAVLSSGSVEIHFGTGETGWSPVDPVPEPATSLLVGLVLVGLGWRGTRTS